jgi:hypothetical protein
LADGFSIQRDKMVSMENTTLGRVLTEPTIENFEDLYAVKRGALRDDQVRRGVVRDALEYDPVPLTIQGRDRPVDVLEVPDNVPVLVGQIPLDNLDLVVDPRGGKLIGNPEHGGEPMFEMC